MVCAALLLSSPACTVGPAAGDGGTGGGPSTGPARSVSDQCQSVLSAFCQKVANCQIAAVDLSECISGNLALCCIGSACNATSTVSESTVTECEQTITAEDCNLVQETIQTMNPTACLGSS
jgi:hypothetical protein